MVIKNILQIPKKFASHQLGRGMIAYGLTFPTGCLIQQYYVKKNLENINWRKCIRYSLYGIFVTAPMLSAWVKIASRIWPKRSLSTAVQKVALEQMTYAPIAISAFFFAMSFFDNNFDLAMAQSDVKRKFWQAYKVNLCYWPIVQTINFTFIPDRNRIVFVSLCGLLWVIFLAYVDSHGSLVEARSPQQIDVSKFDEIETLDAYTKV